MTENQVFAAAIGEMLKRNDEYKIYMDPHDMVELLLLPNQTKDGVILENNTYKKDVD